jgi:hypothetical protein
VTLKNESGLAHQVRLLAGSSGELQIRSVGTGSDLKPGPDGVFQLPGTIEDYQLAFHPRDPKASCYFQVSFATTQGLKMASWFKVKVDKDQATLRRAGSHAENRTGYLAECSGPSAIILRRPGALRADGTHPGNAHAFDLQNNSSIPIHYKFDFRTHIPLEVMTNGKADPGPNLQQGVLEPRTTKRFRWNSLPRYDVRLLLAANDPGSAHPGSYNGPSALVTFTWDWQAGPVKTLTRRVNGGIPKVKLIKGYSDPDNLTSFLIYDSRPGAR